MSIKVIFQTARCITFEIQDGSIFESQKEREIYVNGKFYNCLLYTSPSPRDTLKSRSPASA